MLMILVEALGLSIMRDVDPAVGDYGQSGACSSLCGA